MKKKFKLVDLDCANCAAKMEEAIKKIDGVTSATSHSDHLNDARTVRFEVKPNICFFLHNLFCFSMLFFSYRFSQIHKFLLKLLPNSPFILRFLSFVDFLMRFLYRNKTGSSLRYFLFFYNLLGHFLLHYDLGFHTILVSFVHQRQQSI